MRQKNSTRQTECPEEKLKFLSYIEDLQSSRPLYPITPERANKDWVMDAWEDHKEEASSSPQTKKYIKKMIQNYEVKNFRLRKISVEAEPAISNQEENIPPIEVKTARAELIQKQNASNFQMKRRIQNQRKDLKALSLKKSAKRENLLEMGPFKIALQSVVYPVIRQAGRLDFGQRRLRIDRFHSFIARSVRR